MDVLRRSTSSSVERNHSNGSSSSKSRSIITPRTTKVKLLLESEDESFHLLTPVGQSRYLGEVLKKGDSVRESKTSMISIIEDPIKCGHLLAFCESEHSTENLSFLIEVVRFREYMASDPKAWPYTWQYLDKNNDILNKSSGMQIATKVISGENTLARSGTMLTEDAADDDNANSFNDPISQSLTPPVGQGTGFARLSSLSYWPSKLLRQEAVESYVNSIWSKYLANDAASQICMPSSVLSNTQARLLRLSEYGPEVFGECLLDPIATLQRDIFPRFVVSKFYNDMLYRVASLTNAVGPTDLVVPPPETCTCGSEDRLACRERKIFSLEEILRNRILYREFLSHLQQTVQAENLLCIRMVELFEIMCKNSDPAKEDQAWLIYRFFVAVGSPFEVSLYSRHKSLLMLKLGSPVSGMFSELNKSAMNMLMVNFNSYQFTDSYRNLYKVVLEEMPKLPPPRNHFGFVPSLSTMLKWWP